MKTNPNDLVDPIFEYTDRKGDGTEQINMKGGLTKREYFAMTFAAAMISTSKINSGVAIEHGIDCADVFIKELNKGE